MSTKSPAEGDHWTFEGVKGGGGGGGWLWKKILQAHVGREKLQAAQIEIKKKFLHCCKKEKKMLPSYSSFREVYKIPAKLEPLFPCSLLNSGFGGAAEL